MSRLGNSDGRKILITMEYEGLTSKKLRPTKDIKAAWTSDKTAWIKDTKITHQESENYRASNAKSEYQ